MYYISDLRFPLHRQVAQLNSAYPETTSNLSRTVHPRRDQPELRSGASYLEESQAEMQMERNDSTIYFGRSLLLLG
jgi:hypothetical protein